MIIKTKTQWIGLLVIAGWAALSEAQTSGIEGGTWRWLAKHVVGESMAPELENGWLVRKVNPGIIEFHNDSIEGKAVLEVKYRELPWAVMTVKGLVDGKIVAEWATARQKTMPTQTSAPFEVRKGSVIRVEFHSDDHPADAMAVYLRPWAGVNTSPGEPPLTPYSPAGAMDNRVKNASFEDGPSWWGLDNWSKTEDVSFIIDDKVAHGGLKSARVTSGTRGRHALGQRIAGLEAGKQYQVEFWVKAQDYRYGNERTPAMVSCDFSPVKAVPRPIVSITPEGTFDWKKVSFTFTAPPGTGHLFLIHTAGTLWFDDIRVSELGATTGTTAKKEPGMFTVTKHMAPDGVTLEAVDLDSAHYTATIHSRGGKITRLQAGDTQWCAGAKPEQWASGIGKVSFKEDTARELQAAPYTLSVTETNDGAVVTAKYSAKNDLRGLHMTRTFRFNRDTTSFDVRDDVTNTDAARIVTPTVHNYLNIWRVLEADPLFSVYVGASPKPVRADMVCTMAETTEFNASNAPWAGVINVKSRGLCFQMTGTPPKSWRVWSGGERHKGTLEADFQPIELARDQTWTCAYTVHVTAGLPSYGFVARDVLTSVGTPDVYLLAPAAYGQSLVTLTTRDGGKYQVAGDLQAGASVKVAMSSILHGGEAAAQIQTASRGTINAAPIPRATDAISLDAAEAAGDKPCRYLPLTAKPIPSPGPDGFVYYAADYYQHEAYVSPDVVSMWAFGQHSRLKENLEDIRLVLDVPVGIEILGGRFVRPPIERSDLTLGGKPYTRFTVNLVYDHRKNRGGVTELIVRTTLPAPQETDLFYATRIRGELKEQRKMPLHIIRVPEVSVPKKLFTRFWPLFGVLNDYPDMRSFQHVGFQTPDEAEFQQLIKPGLQGKARDLSARMKLPAEVNVDYMRFMVGEDKSAMNETLDGRKVGPHACPTYRGPDFQKVIEYGQRCLDLGLFQHIFDPERGDGKEICFCERCRKEFKTYWEQNDPGLEYRDPREFMAQASRHRDLHRAWIVFKAEKEAEKYAFYRERMGAYLRDKGLDPGRFRMIYAASPGWRVQNALPGKDRWVFETVESAVEDPRILGKTIDYYAPMIYIELDGRFNMRADLQEIPENLRGLRDFSDGTVNVCPTLSAGYPYTDYSANIEPNGMMKYQVMEAFAGGAKGVILYSEGWFDALDMKYFAEAMRQVVPVEELIASGIPIAPDHLRDLTSTVFVKGLETQAGAVILVSDYSSRVKQARIEYRVNKKASVIDLETGKPIAELTPVQAVFPVELSTNRARLFHVRQDGPVSRIP